MTFHQSRGAEVTVSSGGAGVRPRARAGSVRAAVVVLLAALLWLATTFLPAHADGDPATDIVRGVDVVMTVNPDGTIHVDETYQWDFGTRNGLGFYRDLVQALGYGPDPTKYRVYRYSNYAISSPSGAPAEVWVERDWGDTIRLAAGAPDGSSDTRTGLQTYVLSYDIDGALNAIRGDATVGDRDELYWNNFTDIANPFERVTVTVTGPADVIDVACYQGPTGSTTPCGEYTSAGPTATFTGTALGVGDGISVVAAWPAGTFADIAPILEDMPEDGSVDGGGSGIPATEPGPVLAALLGVSAFVARYPIPVALLWLAVLGALIWARLSAGRDRYYVGLPLGLLPAGGGTATPGMTTAPGLTTAPEAKLWRNPPVTVQFTPPQGLTPAEGGLLLEEQTDNSFFAATMVDLAVRGYITIETAGTGFTGKPNDWRLNWNPAAPDTAVLRPYERRALEDVFEGRRSRLFSDLRGEFAGNLRTFHKGVTSISDDRQYFRTRGLVGTRTRSGGFNFVVPLFFAIFFFNAVGASMFTAVSSITTGESLFPLLIAAFGAVASLVVMFLSTRKAAHARTAYGRAVYEQVRGFRQYLATADAHQLRWEEGQDIFSRYLPWAMVFGVADRWAAIFEQLAMEGRYTYVPTWYVGTHGFDPTVFRGIGTSMDRMVSTGMSNLSYTPGSSGGSGSFGGGGGFSGGGGGGGGAGGR